MPGAEATAGSGSGPGSEPELETASAPGLCLSPTPPCLLFCVASDRPAPPPFGVGGELEVNRMRPMSSGVRELRVWQESVSLAGDVIPAVPQQIRRETKSVSDRVI